MLIIYPHFQILSFLNQNSFETPEDTIPLNSPCKILKKNEHPNPMSTAVQQILLVDNNMSHNHHREEKLREAGIAQEIKIAVNGGHALLYLDHASEKIRNSNLVILLNMDTPIANGFDFLEGYKYSKLNKENILVIVLNDNLDPAKIERTKKFGINTFLSSSFSADELENIIREHFQNQATSAKPTLSKNTNINYSGTFRRTAAAG